MTIQHQITEEIAAQYRAAMRDNTDPIKLCIEERIRLALLQCKPLRLTKEQHDHLTRCLESHAHAQSDRDPVSDPSR
jgi:hypothetical protein